MHASTNRSLWNIPYQRNPFFTGREDVLSQLHKALCAENAVALSHPQGISGLGGIGKTQTALEYAYRYRTEYEAVFWVRAESAIALLSGFVELAQLLDLPERKEKDQSIIVEAVLQWLRRHTGWLLVLDNIDDLSVVEPFLPKAGPGHILLTTRAQALSGIAERLEVRKMEPEIGALLLLRRANILPPQATLAMAIKDDRIVAREISHQLDGLPLALDQAGAYIQQTSCSLANYVALYQTRRREILQARGSFDKDYPASVATTWSLSFEKIGQVNVASIDLLDFCAFMVPDAIPEEVITAGGQHLTPSLQVMATHPLQFDQTIAALLAYSLIDRNTDATLSIHRLVQAVLQNQLEEAEKRSWTKRVILAINAAFPHAEYPTWTLCGRLLPHALLAAQYIETDRIISGEAGRLLHETASYLQDRARYTEAEPLYQQARSVREQQLGPEHPDVASTLHGWANLYQRQGKFAEAESLYQQAHSIREQQLGPEHPDVASILNNLANLYQEQGRFAEAESLFLRALSIWEQQLGPEHPDVAYPLHGLASLYAEQGKFAEAEPLYQRVLSIWEQQLGPEHPDVVATFNNLASLYGNLGKFAEAEPLYQRALSIREQQLGPEHPETAVIVHNLAVLWEAQNHHQEALALYRRALAIREQALGPEHPRTLSTRQRVTALLQMLEEGPHGD